MGEGIKDVEPKIWIDLTTSWLWRGPVVGVTRVEKEVARRLWRLRNRYNIGLCRYDAVKCTFLELEVNETLGLLADAGLEQHSAKSSGQQTQSTTPASGPHSRFEVLKSIAKGGIALLPKPMQRPAMRLAWKAWQAMRQRSTALRAPRAKNSCSNMLPRLRAKGDQQTYASVLAGSEPVVPTHPFRKGDVLITLGLDWDHKDMLALSFLRQYLPIRIVGMCYDVIPVLYPQWSAFKGEAVQKFTAYLINLSWASDVIMCISKTTKNDLTKVLRAHGCRLPTLKVVRLGCALPRPTKDPSEMIQEHLGTRYVLYVSTLEPRKNHEVLYRAYTRLVEYGIKDLPMLVFVGMKGWGVNELVEHIRLDPRTKDLIRILGPVDDSDLAHLYMNSLFCVYPSFYEGWGLPVAEALSYGKLVLCSDRPAIPEVGGEYVEYIDPWDARAWAEEILSYCGDDKKLRMREEKIRADYVPSSWGTTAQTILEVALGLLGEPSSGRDDVREIQGLES